MKSVEPTEEHSNSYCRIYFWRSFTWGLKWRLKLKMSIKKWQSPKD